jgi:hypothetical protein
MARANLLSTRTTTFLELLSTGRLHRVPPYQRLADRAVHLWRADFA